MLRDGEALNPGHEASFLQYRPGNFQIVGLVGVEIILLLIHGLGLFDGFVGYPAVGIGDVQKIIKFSIYLKKCYCLGYRKNKKPRSPSVQSNGVLGQSQTICSPRFPIGVDTGYWMLDTGYWVIKLEI